jgi:RNA polymerase Rpb2, domain 2
VHKMLMCSLGRLEEDDRDHFGKKRWETDDDGHRKSFIRVSIENLNAVFHVFYFWYLSFLFFSIVLKPPLLLSSIYPRLDLAGPLMGGLFRMLFKKLTKEVRLQHLFIPLPSALFFICMSLVRILLPCFTSTCLCSYHGFTLFPFALLLPQPNPPSRPPLLLPPITSTPPSYPSSSTPSILTSTPPSFPSSTSFLPPP